MLITHKEAAQQALIVVDPHTGYEIPHVKAADPAQGWLEVYTTTPCAPFSGMQMQMITVENGIEVTKILDYTFVVMRDPMTGLRTFLTATVTGCYDLVNKHTGEVLYSSAKHGALPERFLTPAAYILRMQAGVAASPSQECSDETCGFCPDPLEQRVREDLDDELDEPDLCGCLDLSCDGKRH